MLLQNNSSQVWPLLMAREPEFRWSGFPEFSKILQAVISGFAKVTRPTHNKVSE